MKAIPVSILAIVVLYRQEPLRSPGLTSLLKAAEAVNDATVRLAVIVADNTPGGQATETPLSVRLRSYPQNPGLALPYNDALATAEREGFDWLLTLDQDTELPVDFVACMAVQVRQFAASPEIGAIVPHVVDRGRPISPMRFRGGFLPRVVPLTATGRLGRYASAINSGSLLRVQALREIGGYAEEFPLHHSDTLLYQRLDARGKRMALAGNVTVPHELAILDRTGRMSTDRYREMLRDERAFWDRHMGIAGRMERLVRLAGRVTKGVLQGEDRRFVRLAGWEFLHRLFTPRKSRMRGSRMAAGASHKPVSAGERGASEPARGDSSRLP